MAFLDFIKNRQAEQKSAQQTPKQQPQTAREMYAAKDAQEKTNQKPLTPEIKAQADRVLGRAEQASSFLQSSSAPSSGGETRGEPMRQKQMNQDKAAPALSPTTEQVGKVAEKGQSGRENDARGAGIHNRATPDEIKAGERGLANTPPESRKQKESPQNQPEKAATPSRGRGGWER
jgi:hypothetical protein